MKLLKIKISLVIFLLLFNIACTSQTETPSETESGVTKTQIVTNTTSPDSNEIKTNESAQDTNQHLQEEPSIPITSKNLFEAEQGIEQRKLSKFYNTLAQEQFYFAYQTDDLVNNQLTNYILSFSKDGTKYSMISDESDTQESLVLNDGSFFILDREEKIAFEIFLDDNSEIYSYDGAINEILLGLETIYFLGEGQASFLGQNSTFEEYTLDNHEYIRYYFSDDNLLGYRIFDSNSKINLEMTVVELTNDLSNYQELFYLPEDFSIQALHLE
ncbi:MAG: hypothetical protein GX326_04820 [Clostridiaceae bacterium]|nr:hypothetical protein [Clostridiaceae bacterium]